MKLLSTNKNKEWHEILNRVDSQDIFYQPEYMTIYEQETHQAPFTHFGGQGQLFVYGDRNNFIIYPFFKRSISHLNVTDIHFKDMYDIISPYGFGGPLAQVNDKSVDQILWEGFYKSFDAYCTENKIISEFCRLHPMFENGRIISKFAPGITEKVGQIVYFDLSYSEEKILSNMIHGHRRKIKSALNNGNLSFETTDLANPAKCFYELYNDNMMRIGANNIYFFSQEFYEAAFHYLKEHLSFWRVSYKGNVCAGLLVLKYGTQAYAWLSGTRTESLMFHPNNLLIYASCIELKREGFKYFNLGGGKTVNGSSIDTLFSFKSGFTKLKKDFYIYKRIHLLPDYERLVLLRPFQNAENNDFFPKYRLDEL